MINLDSLLHNFLSSGINMSDRETIRKIKVLNLFQIVFVMTAPLLGLFYFYVGAIQLFYIIIMAGLLMISAIILMRKVQDLTVAGNYAVFILWATIFLITWYTGFLVVFINGLITFIDLFVSDISSPSLDSRLVGFNIFCLLFLLLAISDIYQSSKEIACLVKLRTFVGFRRMSKEIKMIISDLQQKRILPFFK